MQEMVEGVETEGLAEFRARAREWLSNRLDTAVSSNPNAWGVGSDSVAIFRTLNHEGERAHILSTRRWIQEKADAGFANLTWEVEWGGQGLPATFEAAFADEERAFVTPPGHEAVSITVGLVAPTIRVHGTPEQRERFLPPMLRTDEMWCQLFSEPGAGSDLAGLSARADRDGDGWVLNGQKVWTSGAQFADFGYLLARTDPGAPKHRGITAFLLPMNAEGVDVRPLRQMTGGASFNEVFLTDVRVSDWWRLGEIGDGWGVALTTLGFERTASQLKGDTVARLIGLAQHLGVSGEPVIRQSLARAFIHSTLAELTKRRAAARLAAGSTPGPEGSLDKLIGTEGLRLYADVAGLLLGPRLAADTEEWGTYTWSEYVLGVPGARLAGGTDEIQRNVIGERFLGLPREPRVS